MTCIQTRRMWTAASGLWRTTSAQYKPCTVDGSRSTSCSKQPTTYSETNGTRPEKKGAGQRRELVFSSLREPFITLKHVEATLHLMRSEMGNQCSFFVCFPGEVLSGGGEVPRERVLQQSFEFSGEGG